MDGLRRALSRTRTLLHTIKQNEDGYSDTKVARPVRRLDKEVEGTSDPLLSQFSLLGKHKKWKSGLSYLITFLHS